MRIDANGKRWYTRYEMHIERYKDKLQATLYDEYWDKHTLLWYSQRNPAKATGIGGQAPTLPKFWKAMPHRISCLSPGWYSIEMPATQYPFGDIFTIRCIPGRHLRYRNCSDEQS